MAIVVKHGYLYILKSTLEDDVWYLYMYQGCPGGHDSRGMEEAMEWICNIRSDLCMHRGFYSEDIISYWDEMVEMLQPLSYLTNLAQRRTIESLFSVRCTEEQLLQYLQIPSVTIKQTWLNWRDQEILDYNVFSVH